MDENRAGKEGVGGDESRYRLLETILDYAQEQLGGSEEAEAVQRQHATYYLSLAEEAERELQGPQQVAWMERLEKEHDNLRKALQWAVDHEEAEIGLRLGGALWQFWLQRGNSREGQEWLTRLLAMPGAAERTAARGRALFAAGGCAATFGGPEVTLFQESLAIARELGDRWGMSDALSYLAAVAREAGDYEAARARYEESRVVDAPSDSKSLYDTYEDGDKRRSNRWDMAR